MSLAHFLSKGRMPAGEWQIDISSDVLLEIVLSPGNY